MHNTHQSFASRQRMLDADGDASNQVIWFTDARPGGGVRPDARGAGGDGRVDGATSGRPPWTGRRGQQAGAATDRCFTTDGSLIAAGADVWDGILDDKPAGAVHAGVPDPLARRGSSPAGRSRAASTSARCSRSSKAVAARPVRLVAARTRRRSARLKQIFPTGVCDYTQRDVGLPPELRGKGR